MGVITPDLPIEAGNFSGSFRNYMDPPAIHSVLDEREFINQRFDLYQGSGGGFASLLLSTPSGGVIAEVYIEPQGKLVSAINEICITFGLSKEELTKICKVRSRKSLYNWINQEAKPRKATMDRIFDLLVLARAWRTSGFAADTEQIHEPVLNDQSVFDLLNQPEIDRERVLFAGSRLNMMSSATKELSDPFNK